MVIAEQSRDFRRKDHIQARLSEIGGAFSEDPFKAQMEQDRRVLLGGEVLAAVQKPPPVCGCNDPRDLIDFLPGKRTDERRASGLVPGHIFPGQVKRSDELFFAPSVRSGAYGIAVFGEHEPSDAVIPYRQPV